MFCLFQLDAHRKRYASIKRFVDLFHSRVGVGHAPSASAVDLARETALGGYDLVFGLIVRIKSIGRSIVPIVSIKSSSIVDWSNSRNTVALRNASRHLFYDVEMD